MRTQNSKIAKIVFVGTMDRIAQAVAANPALARVSFERISVDPPEPGGTECWIKVANWRADEGVLSFVDRVEQTLSERGIRVLRRTLESVAGP